MRAGSPLPSVWQTLHWFASFLPSSMLALARKGAIGCSAAGAGAVAAGSARGLDPGDLDVAPRYRLAHQDVARMPDHRRDEEGHQARTDDLVDLERIHDSPKGRPAAPGSRLGGAERR